VIELSYFICVFLLTRPFYWYQFFSTLWPWPSILTHVLKTLTLAISFEWYVIWLLYFICMLLVTRSLYWSRKFWNLDIGFWRWRPLVEFASYGAFVFTYSFHTFLDFQLFPHEYHGRDWSSRNAHLVQHNWYCIGFTF
jgi:hypothetical protein